MGGSARKQRVDSHQFGAAGSDAARALLAELPRQIAGDTALYRALQQQN